ncbi:MAG: hypothetical protein ACK2UB_11080 [Anaerolineales bacterium]
MKIRPNALHVFLALIVMMAVCAAPPTRTARAAIGQVEPWTLVAQGSNFIWFEWYSVGAGTDRLMVVAVSSTMTSTSTQTVNVWYGFQALTLAVGDGTTGNIQTHTYLFYLLDTPAVMDGTSRMLLVTTGGGGSNYDYIYAAVYDGVDQSDPIGDYGNYYNTNQTRNIGPLNLDINTGERAVEVINLFDPEAQSPTINSWANDWYSVLGPDTYNSRYSSYIAANDTASPTNSRHRTVRNCYPSMSAIVIKPFMATPTPTSTSTPTATATPFLLTGYSAVLYPSLLINAPDFGLDAQTIYGKVAGGNGPPYSVEVHILDPEGGTRGPFFPPVAMDGTFSLTPAFTGDTYFGADVEGVWEAWYIMTDSLGDTRESTHVYWAVNFPRAHGVP